MPLQQLVGRRLQAPGVASGKHHPRALVYQPPRGGQADPAAAADDESYLPFES
jgi:hypothetical protein